MWWFARVKSPVLFHRRGQTNERHPSKFISQHVLSVEAPPSLSPWTFVPMLKRRVMGSKEVPPKNVIVPRGADDIRLSARGRVRRVWGRCFVCGLRRPHRLPVSIINCRTSRRVPLYFSQSSRAEWTWLNVSASPWKGHLSEILLLEMMPCCISF